MQYESYLQHHGIKGQKWGVRRYQNMDGSLTSKGRQRYEFDGSKSTVYTRFNDRPPKIKKAAYSYEQKRIDKANREQKLKRTPQQYRRDALRDAAVAGAAGASAVALRKHGNRLGSSLATGIAVGRGISSVANGVAYGRSRKRSTNTKSKSNKGTSKWNQLSKGQKQAIKLGVGAAAVTALSVGGYQYLKRHPEGTNRFFTGQSPAYDQAAKEGKKFVMFMGSGHGNIGRGRMARGFSVLSNDIIVKR